MLLLTERTNAGSASTRDAELLRAIRARVDVTVFSAPQLVEVAAAARRAGVTARVQLKLDVARCGDGCSPEAWPVLAAVAQRLTRAGLLEVRGVWAQFVRSEEPEPAAQAGQIARFEGAILQARRIGVRPRLCHLADAPAAPVTAQPV
jgi:alanine racemase